MASNVVDDMQSTENNGQDKVFVEPTLKKGNIVSQQKETRNDVSQFSTATTATTIEANHSELVSSANHTNGGISDKDTLFRHQSEVIAPVNSWSEDYLENLAVQGCSPKTHNLGTDEANLSRLKLEEHSNGDGQMAHAFDSQTTDPASRPMMEFNSSGEALHEDLEMTSSRETEYLIVMMDRYKKKLYEWWKNHKDYHRKKGHTVIAALICDQKDKKPCAAILATGTHYNDRTNCRSDGTCDGHAESVIYELIPKYFMREMEIAKGSDKRNSIFEFLSKDLGFKLKSDVTFHLMVTEPPCGFITTQNKPCFEWKRPFEEFPHVPTCSSRIMIGGTMGIQGYVSHLLSEPIYIQSVIICCEQKYISKLKFEVGAEFQMPELKKIIYDPEELQDYKFHPLNKLADEQFKNGNAESAVTMIGTSKSDGSFFFAFNSLKGMEAAQVKDIDPSLKVKDDVETERKQTLKTQYDQLCTMLKLEEQAKKLRIMYMTSIEQYKKKISSSLGEICDKLTELQQQFDRNEDFEISNNLNDNPPLKKLHDIKKWEDDLKEDKKMKNRIENAMAKKALIPDCFWQQYFFSKSIELQSND